MAHGAPVVLLGPQRFNPTLYDTLSSLGLDGPVAAVTAGWQEREDEDGELREHLRRPTRNLQLYRRHDDVLQRDAELAAALREAQERKRNLQELYRLRLGYGLDAARELFAREGGGELVEEQRLALAHVRLVDRQHLARVERVGREFEARWRPSERPAVARHRREIAAILGRSSTLAIAGGHVAVVLNRLRLFAISTLAARLPIVAWSAGAMALARRVVLFHDHPPQGAGHAEVLDAGLGLGPGVVVLPHARQRLALDEPTRVALLARRFAPATCALLDPGARLDWHGTSWNAAPGTRRLAGDGTVREFVG